MNTKHTKGNWQVAMQPEMHFNIGAYIPGQGCVGLVATVDQNRDIDFEQAEANAKLIAAAPDLLEALKIATLYVSSISDKEDWQKIQAVIKKATVEMQLV